MVAPSLCYVSFASVAEYHVVQLSLLQSAVLVLVLEVEYQNLGMQILLVSISPTLSVSLLVLFVPIIFFQHFTVKFLHMNSSQLGRLVRRTNTLKFIRRIVVGDGFGLLMDVREFALGSDGVLPVALLVAPQILLEVCQQIIIVGQYACFPWFAVVESISAQVFHHNEIINDYNNNDQLAVSAKQ